MRTCFWVDDQSEVEAIKVFWVAIWSTWQLPELGPRDHEVGEDIRV